MVRPSTVSGRCDAPPSKSYTHRAFTLALLADSTLVREPLLGEDCLATLAAVERLGGKVERRPEGVLVQGAEPQTPDDVIDCRNSGTTMRLITAVAALAPGTSVLTGDATLRRRPMQALLDALHPLGAEAWSTRGNGAPPVVVRGPLQGGHTSLAGDVSSQYVSALVLAGTRAPKGLELAVTTPLKSRPYVDITLDMVRRFGGRVDVAEPAVPDAGPTFRVPGRQRLQAAEYRVPGDFSSAAFPLGAAAITGGTVAVGNLDLANPQGDKAIVDVLARFGCKVRKSPTEVAVTGGALHGTTVDLGDTPDMFPLLCAVAAHARGETVLHNARHLRFKESDRIAAMARELRKMGVDIVEREDGAVIRGGPVHAANGVETHGDHRVLMACAVAALGADGPVEIIDDGSHAVSYPSFPDDLRRMGGDVEVRP